MALKRVTSGEAIIIERPSKPGKPGKDGVTTVITETVTKVLEGEPGPIGPMPKHQVRNGEVRFEQPDGLWGPWIETQASGQSNPGGGGPLSFNTYTLVEQAVFRVTAKALLFGHNIIGVNFAGDVTIFLPSGIDKRILITVKDESNNAGTFNITVTTET